MEAIESKKTFVKRSKLALYKLFHLRIPEDVKDLAQKKKRLGAVTWILFKDSISGGGELFSIPVASGIGLIKRMLHKNHNTSLKLKAEQKKWQNRGLKLLGGFEVAGISLMVFLTETTLMFAAPFLLIIGTGIRSIYLAIASSSDFYHFRKFKIKIPDESITYLQGAKINSLGSLINGGVSAALSSTLAAGKYGTFANLGLSSAEGILGTAIALGQGITQYHEDLNQSNSTNVSKIHRKEDEHLKKYILKRNSFFHQKVKYVTSLSADETVSPKNVEKVLVRSSQKQKFK